MDTRAYLRLLLTPSRWGRLVTGRLSSVADLDVASLKAAGVRLLVFDVDDTLAGYLDPLSAETLAWLRQLSGSFRLAIVTNATSLRRQELKTQLGDLPVSISPSSKKPSPQGFFEAMGATGVPPDQTAAFGDRAAVDLAAAERAGIPHRFLVQPYSGTHSATKAPAWYRVARAIENFLMG